MTGDELRKALAYLELKHSQFARMVGLHPRTVRKYLAGVVAIPTAIALIIKLFLMYGIR